MKPHNNTADLLALARQSKDLDAVAIALTKHADTLVKEGKLSEARSLLEEEILLHQKKMREYDEARCTQFVATLCRLEGNIDDAYKWAMRAKQLAGHSNPVIVAAETELGEISFARGDSVSAVTAFGNAINEGLSAGLLPEAQAVLRRKYALALSSIGNFTRAASELAIAGEQFLEAGNVTEAIRSKIEEAAALQSAGDYVFAKRIHDIAKHMAVQEEDHKAIADLHLFIATQAIQRHDLAAALDSAIEARTESLLAIAPDSYIAAACAISDLADRLGDRLVAYEALVVGWATLGDLSGNDVAKALFSPKLLALVKSWGDKEFRKIKAEYEEKRKFELSASVYN